MKLLPYRWRNSESRIAREREQNYRRPDQLMVTILLLRALSDNADGICFGFRPEISADPELQQTGDLFSPPESPQLPSDDLLCRAVASSAFALRSVTGECAVPISFRIDGQLRHSHSLPVHLYGMLLKAIEFRPLALGASEDNPQPLRHIYLPHPEKKTAISISWQEGKRLFVEVDFEYQSDNTFWIYIQGTRWVGSEMRVSDTVY